MMGSFAKHTVEVTFTGELLGSYTDPTAAYTLYVQEDGRFLVHTVRVSGERWIDADLSEWSVHTNWAFFD